MIFFAETKGCEVSGDCVDTIPELSAVVLLLLTASPSPFAPYRQSCHASVSNAWLEVRRLADGQTIASSNAKSRLIMRWHAHDRAVAVGDQHMVPDPRSTLSPVSGWVTNRPGGNASLFPLSASRPRSYRPP